MNYIKFYKIFENLEVNSIKNDVDDIFIELKDIGYKVSFNIEEHKLSNEFNSYKIVLRMENGSSDDFKTSDIKEYLMRYKDYFKFLNIKFSGEYIFTMPSVDCKTISEFYNLDENSEIYVFIFDFWTHIDI